LIRALLAIGLLGAAFTASAELLNFNETERQQILRHGPWPLDWSPDPSNRVSGRRAAIELGRALFFDPRLSGTGTIQCSTCHLEIRAWQDGRVTGAALGVVDRNTPSLLDVRSRRWFGWDGANDNLWAQSIRPLFDPREMKASAAHVARLLRSDEELRSRYQRAFGTAPGSDEEAILVDVGKALAAFQETLVSGRTLFDNFRDALARNDHDAAAAYPISAQRGLRIFIGRGKCNVCHFGPSFTNGEFADVGIPFFVAPGKVDPGRHGGIGKVKQSRFNLLGPYNDDPTRRTATGTRYVEAQHRNFGEFRVPSLRNVAHTAPYMHNGRLPTLRDVVKRYSEIDLDRLHADGERILKPLHLKENEIDDMVAFLESLTEKSAVAAMPAAPKE
jgi:cytochrome c peroxidase